MKQFCTFAACLAIGPALSGWGDSITLLGGRTVQGTVLQTNESNVLMLTEYGALNYSPSTVTAINIERAESLEINSTNRMPDSRSILFLLSQQQWAKNLKQIPATVIDTGILKNVPYVSFRCGEDYEVNIYGDPERPAGIEAGVYRNLLEDDAAKSNCLAFLAAVLRETGDKDLIRRLNGTKDLREMFGLKFEVTPPSDPDAYNGWWISVYSEEKLKLARASDAELKEITARKSDVAKGIGRERDSGSWSPDDLKSARVPPAFITFRTPSGDMLSNVFVKPYIPGVSLIWRDTNSASGGIVKLADLPEDLRTRFGYDPVKEVLAAENEARRKAREREQAQARATALAQAATQADPYSTSASGALPSSPYASEGAVFVRGYTRKNGTYVHSYTRRR